MRKETGYRRFQSILAISGKEINVVPRVNVVNAVETAFRELALGNVVVPEKLFVKLPTGVRYALMSSYIGGSLDVLGTKLLGTNLDNPSKFNLPGNVAVVTLNDARTGELLALMEGSIITAMRTAACCAVATKYMARTDSEILGVFGAGLVGKELLLAISQVRDVKKIKLYDLPQFFERCRSVCEEIRNRLGIDAVAVRTPREVVEGSCIVCTATTSKTPVFKTKWLEKGTHINSVGIARGTAREIEDMTIQMARKPIVVDLKEHMFKEGLANDVLVPIADSLLSKNDIIDLSNLVAGKEIGREEHGEITFFKSGGSAIEDVAAAKVVYDLSRAKGLGTMMQM